MKCLFALVFLTLNVFAQHHGTGGYSAGGGKAKFELEKSVQSQPVSSTILKHSNDLGYLCSDVLNILEARHRRDPFIDKDLEELKKLQEICSDIRKPKVEESVNQDQRSDVKSSKNDDSVETDDSTELKSTTSGQ